YFVSLAGKRADTRGNQSEVRPGAVAATVALFQAAAGPTLHRPQRLVLAATFQESGGLISITALATRAWLSNLLPSNVTARFPKSIPTDLEIRLCRTW